MSNVTVVATGNSVSVSSGHSVETGGVYSSIDSRNYGNFPNSSRNVNNTLTFDVQTSSNAAVPSADSRAAGAPADSRVSPNIPLNSRAPGVYGPGV